MCQCYIDCSPRHLLIFIYTILIIFWIHFISFEHKHCVIDTTECEWRTRNQSLLIVNKSSKFCHQLPSIHGKNISLKFTIWSLIAIHTCYKIVHKGSIFAKKILIFLKIVEFIFTMYFFTDIDECEPTNPCGDVCTDATPGYVCSCSVSGTKLDNDLKKLK
jgi:hypothetical protein